VVKGDVRVERRPGVGYRITKEGFKTVLVIIMNPNRILNSRVKTKAGEDTGITVRFSLVKDSWLVQTGNVDDGFDLYPTKDLASALRHVGRIGITS
jgi:hypothetical protein